MRVQKNLRAFSEIYARSEQFTRAQQKSELSVPQNVLHTTLLSGGMHI